MRRNSLIYIGLVVLGLCISCTSKPNVSITFCESLDQQDQCLDSSNRFAPARQIFVRLSSNKPFVTKKIRGKIFRLQSNNGEMISLGTKDFDIKPGETYITQSIPFQEFGPESIGDFKVIFYDENEQVIAERELVIAQE